LSSVLGTSDPGAEPSGWVDRLATELGGPWEVIDIETSLDLARETAEGVCARPTFPLTGSSSSTRRRPVPGTGRTGPGGRPGKPGEAPYPGDRRVTPPGCPGSGVNLHLLMGREL